MKTQDVFVEFVFGLPVAHDETGVNNLHYRAAGFSCTRLRRSRHESNLVSFRVVCNQMVIGFVFGGGRDNNMLRDKISTERRNTISEKIYLLQQIGGVGRRCRVHNHELIVIGKIDRPKWGINVSAPNTRSNSFKKFTIKRTSCL